MIANGSIHADALDEREKRFDEQRRECAGCKKSFAAIGSGDKQALLARLSPVGDCRELTSSHEGAIQASMFYL